MLPIDEPPLTPALIRARYDSLLARFRAVAEAADRDPDAMRIVAVTKGFPVGVVHAAREAGLTSFGENRVQEALPKVAEVPDAEWHLVGHLQANKVRSAARAFAVIHSVDSLELLLRLERIAAEESRTPTLLLQVNVAGETSKTGFTLGWFEDQLRHRGALLAALTDLASVRIAGLMTIAPHGVSANRAREVFARLRGLRNGLEHLVGRPLPELSMGMTGDAEAAVAEGATLVRIGTAIFGPRPA